MSKRFSRFFAMALLAVSAVGMVAVSFDAEARRFGGGKSFGKQSSRVTQNQPAAAAPPAATTTQRSASSAAPAAAAAGTAAKSGMSRFLGPLAGIAAGLGIAALLSHLGLGGAFLEMMSSLILIALVIFAIMFIVRRLRGPRTATQAAGGAMRREGMGGSDWTRPATPPVGTAPASAAPASMTAAEPAPVAQQNQDGWFIPQGFDTAAFLANAKKQFVAIQGVWDSGDVDQLGEYLTDDLIAEFRPQIQAREGRPEHTEVVLLNAELLGIEAVAGGHLASVRYSGMLREAPGAEAFRFEEVWNLYKAENAGWLLAGIQQMPGQQAN